MKPKQVVLGLYTGPVVPAAMPMNVMSMAWELSKAGMWYFDTRLWHESCRVDSNRNYLIHDFLHKTTADFLFIIDADMKHPGIAPVVLANRDLPIVCGLYFQRRQDGVFCPHFYRHNGESPDDRRGHGHDVNNHYTPMTSEVVQCFSQFPTMPFINEPVVLINADGSPTDKGLMRIDASGFGCAMLRRDALETIEAAGGPFLRDEPGLNGDLAFYKRAGALGIPIWGDASVISSHAFESYIGLQAFHGFVERSRELTEAHEAAQAEAAVLAAGGHW